MSEPFIGEIRAFGFNFAPRGWATCDGQLLGISPNTALFSLLGTTYGGNGQTTFALPDLRGRVPIHAGQGPGLSPYTQGQVGGTEAVTLGTGELPAHSHGVRAASQANSIRPLNAVLAPVASSGFSTYASATDGTPMNPDMVAPTGGGQPHANVQPYLVLNYCIALEGIFPARN